MSFEPKIVTFLCNWCSYNTSKLADTVYKKYAPNVRVIRVGCSGRIEPSFILEALARGADGVLICGCHPGDCHYCEGNYKTIRRILLLKKMLAQMGIEDERVRLEWISELEGKEFVSIANSMTEQVRKLGPFHRNGGGNG